ncbi:hypothetical protein [Erythrobacter neustonensis]|uniref:DUF2029 domain-containing protein n=1 Tax=Erythrobacter neustonensis TaxID=1112 RepID=A0A192D6L4_9SPHN|nr:hypothetical protein [Erythrobacter neustonensis]ANK13414.1 hypothetical protein A9D12_11220 [Erythrobacter neustonensis]
MRIPADPEAQPAHRAIAVLQELRAYFSGLDSRDMYAAIATGLMMTAVSAWRIRDTQLATIVNNCIFGADSATYAMWLDAGNPLGLGVKKHTLAVLLVGALSKPLAFAGVPERIAAGLAMAAIWGGGAGAAFLYFRQAKMARLASAAFTALAMSSFGLITHSGIVETYGVTVLMIAVACLILPAAAAIAAGHTAESAMMAGAVGAGLALANAPAIAFMLVYYACLPLKPGSRADRRKLGLCIVLPMLMTLLAVIAPAIVAEGVGGTAWHRDYLGRYASPDNLTDVQTLANYAAAVLVFSFVAPLDFIQCRFVVEHLFALFDRPIAVIAWTSVITLLIAGIARSARKARGAEVGGILAAVALILLFYLLFNPDEALLYSPQWLLAVFFAASPDFRGVAAWAGAAAAASLAVNLPPLHDKRSFDPAVCCPDPPASMLPREHPAAIVLPRTLSRNAR